ncbi:MAG: membrane protein insertion efficiency factor YidD [Candidatus Cloacimonadaceae bacterium]|nr:membrane protein insertion efficiency factor YidD [Actinomycetota bacterium]MDZ4183044.1 membrane protein insertion efficiency factor YidD [Candidatus Cloacimonadaceae bacterium]
MTKILLLPLFTLGFALLGAKPIDMSSFVIKTPPSAPRNHSPNAFSPMFSFYEDFISPIDGDRCRMHPSCSAFAKEALSAGGMIIGAVMSADRLMRCGFDLSRYRQITSNGKELYLDPLPKKAKPR